jgi:hypothetical protein
MEIVNWMERIDHGAFAEVWKAEDDLGRVVAVKLLDPSMEAVSSAVDHAKALARAKHKNVVEVYYIIEVKHPTEGYKASAIVMELLEGQNLSDLMRLNCFTASKAKSIGGQIIDGLDAIHERGLAHGDLHAGNVIISEDNVKIIDILYLKSMMLLSTTSKQERIRHDYLQVKMLLADIIEHSELDFGEVRAFNAALASDSPDLASIKEAFLSACDPSKAGALDRRVDFAYDKFCDPDFVDTSSYAMALDDETANEVVLPLLNRVIDHGDCKDVHARYVALLWDRVSKENQDILLLKIAAKLDATISVGKWYPHMVFLDACGSDAWLRLPRLTRLRAEAIIVKNILTGRYDIYATINRGGELGTWAVDIGEYFEDRDGLVDALVTMLCRDWYTQNYVGKYLMRLLPLLADTSQRERQLKDALDRAIWNDARLIKENLRLLPLKWQQDLRKK